MQDLENKLEELSRNQVDPFVCEVEVPAVEKFLARAPTRLVDKIFENCGERTIGSLSSNLNVDVLRRALENASDKSLRHFVDGSSLSSLRRLASSAPNILVERLIDAASSQKHRETILKALPVERRRHWDTYIKNEKNRVRELKEGSRHATESLVEERKKINDELSDAIKSQQEILAEAERAAQAQKHYLKSEISAAEGRLNDLREEITARESEFKKREEDIARKIAELNQEHQKQVQQRIKIKVPEYVSAAVKVLEDLEEQFKKKAKAWSLHGTIVLVIAVMATAAISMLGSGVFDQPAEEIGWPMLVFISFKGLVVLSVLGLWARHAFTVSNAYMDEAIKRSDRAHAINFGKLYFEIYGDAVDRSELIEIFENWNIASESAFSRIKVKSSDIRIGEQLSELIKVAKGAEKITS